MTNQPRRANPYDKKPSNGKSVTHVHDTSTSKPSCRGAVQSDVFHHKRTFFGMGIQSQACAGSIAFAKKARYKTIKKAAARNLKQNNTLFFPGERPNYTSEEQNALRA